MSSDSKQYNTEPKIIIRTMSSELEAQKKEFLRPTNILIPEGKSVSQDEIDLEFTAISTENLPPRGRRSSKSGSADLLFTSANMSYPSIMIPENRTKTPRSPSVRSLKSTSSDGRSTPISPTDRMFGSTSSDKYDGASPSHLLMERYKQRVPSLADFEVY